MRTLPEAKRLYLDFDGVLCNSLEECLRSSWLASIDYQPDKLGSEHVPEPPFDAAYRKRFLACRPFIRSGEDYLMVHQWAARGEVPESQAAFDQSIAAAGFKQMAAWKDSLYRVRDGLLEKNRKLWLSWNPLYAGLAQALALQANNPAVLILSTKKAAFIVEILASNSVAWPLERTIYTGPRKKLDIIEQSDGSAGSILIDDQIDHLDFNHPSCRCFLALWGYISPQAAQQASEALTLPQAAALISGFPNA